MYRVQVLLSTYNGEKYIREQLDSILAQKNVEVSVLIRDDGSTDSTVEIINDYCFKNSDIKLIKAPAERLSLDADRLDYLLLPRLIGPVCLHGCDPVQNIQPLRDFSEGGVLSVEVRRILMHNEELRARGVGVHRSCH